MGEKETCSTNSLKFNGFERNLFNGRENNSQKRLSGVQWFFEKIEVSKAMSRNGRERNFQHYESEVQWSLMKRSRNGQEMNFQHQESEVQWSLKKRTKVGK